MSLQTAAYQAVQRDLTQIFNAQMEQATPFYPELTTMVDSNSIDEKYGWLGSLPGMREWLGDRQFKQLRAADYTLRNKDWEASLEFEKNDVDDDRMAGLRARIEDLADESTYHPDELLFDVIDAGETTACFDGQFFFDTDHAWGDSGNQSNDLSASASSPSDPTAAEFKTAFHAALLAMLGFKNDQGKYFFRPRGDVGQLTGLICAVPLNMLEAATRTFEQTFSLEGGAATTNVILARPRIVPIQYYDNTDRWDLFNMNGRIRPFIFQARRPLSFQMKGADDIEFKALKAMTWARYNIGYGHWAGAVRTTFS